MSEAPSPQDVPRWLDREDASVLGALQRDLARYVSLPGQRAKATRLAKHAKHGPRILAALRRARYREGELDRYDVQDFAYWGMVLVGLLDPGTRVALLRDLLGDEYTLPWRDQQLTILHATVQAALPFAAGDEAFAQLAAELAVFANARLQATESTAWARDLGLPFGGSDGWNVSIYIPHSSNGGTAVMSATLLLELRPHPDFPWSVHLSDERDRRYSERPNGVAQDDIGLPPLERLARFPEWLRALPPHVTYDTARAEIYGKGLRGVKPRVLAWLRDGRDV